MKRVLIFASGLSVFLVVSTLIYRVRHRNGIKPTDHQVQPFTTYERLTPQPEQPVPAVL